jgi:hypothetical protein
MDLNQIPRLIDISGVWPEVMLQEIDLIRRTKKQQELTDEIYHFIRFGNRGYESVTV